MTQTDMDTAAQLAALQASHAELVAVLTEAEAAMRQRKAPKAVWWKLCTTLDKARQAQR